LNPPLERALTACRVRNRRLRKFLATNLAAHIAISPLFAFHFGYVLPYGWLANVLIMPTVTLLVVVGALTGVVGLFSMTAAGFLAGTIFVLFRFYDAVARAVVQLPGALWVVGHQGAGVTLAVFGMLLAWVYWLDGYGEVFRARVKVMVLAFALFTVVVAGRAATQRGLRVTELVLDGQSTVLHSPDVTVVIDGGGNNRLLGGSTGNRTVIPFLNHIGTHRADAAFVSSAARSHIFGIIELVIEGRVRTVYVPSSLDLSSGLGRRLVTAVENEGVALVVLHVGDEVALGRMRVRVQEVAPQMVLEVWYNGEVVLFP